MSKIPCNRSSSGIEYVNMEVLSERAVSFGFIFGDHDDPGRLIVSYPKNWDGHFPPSVRVEVGVPATWHDYQKGPPASCFNRAIIRAACDMSGLQVAYRGLPWEQDGEDLYRRHCVFVGDNSARLAEIFPYLFLAKA